MIAAGEGARAMNDPTRLRRQLEEGIQLAIGTEQVARELLAELAALPARPVLVETYHALAQQADARAERLAALLAEMGARQRVEIPDGARGLVSDFHQSEVDLQTAGAAVDWISLATAMQLVHYQLARTTLLVELARALGEIALFDRLRTLRSEVESSRRALEDRLLTLLPAGRDHSARIQETRANGFPREKT